MKDFGPDTFGELYADIYYQRELHWSRVMAEAKVVGKPFWFPQRRGKTPPDPY